jgi:hypothetical protein
LIFDRRTSVVSHVDLGSQGEAVQQFFRSLAADPEGVVVELNGQALARLVPIAAPNGAGDDDDTWTDAKNARRCFLVDREIDGTLTPEEARELAVLQCALRRHVDKVAPLPIEAARKLRQQLLGKAAKSRPDA